MKAEILQLIAERIGRNYSYGNEPVAAALNELREAVERLPEPLPPLLRIRFSGEPLSGPGIDGSEPIIWLNAGGNQNVIDSFRW